MGGLDRREQGVILGAMMPVQSRAEALAEQQQVAGRRNTGASRRQRLAGDVECFTQASVHAPEFQIPGDQPGRVALSHARTKVGTRASSLLRSGASMPDPDGHRHATLAGAYRHGVRECRAKHVGAGTVLSSGRDRMAGADKGRRL